MKAFCNEIKLHYSTNWANDPVVKHWAKGPVTDLPPSFCVLEFAPTVQRQMWTYATCCMSQPSDGEGLELHLFSPARQDSHVELLTLVAHYHLTAQTLGLGHTVNFGRPWMPDSTCDHGLISLPYLDGIGVEEFRSRRSETVVRCLWLIPITQAEREYKKANGLEALEQAFDKGNLNYIDPLRKSVV